uniref:Putative plant transposon protein domain-containing protein n=1 Tax=Solanum tuberosum TaxID=4113 RepID=M1DRG0_SOLTU
MSVNGSNGSQVGHQDDIGNLNDVNEPNVNNPHLMGGIGAFRLPPAEGNAMFHITSWREKGPVGYLLKKSASPTWTVVGLKKFYVVVYKIRRAQAKIGVSQNGSAITNSFVIWTPTLIEGPVKLGERLNDPFRIRTTQTTTSPLASAHAVFLATPMQGSPPRSMKRLKTEGLRTIIEGKRLPTDGVIDRSPEIMSCMKSHKLQLFTKPHDPYVPNWVQEFYTTYGALVPQWKKSAAKFKTVDYVVVRGRKLKCDSDAIHVVLECSTRIKDDCEYKIRTKTLENRKKWLAPLISDAPGPVGISTTAPSMTPSTSTAPLPPRSGTVVDVVSLPPLNQVSLLRMGQLAHSADRRSSRHEATIPVMIKRALANVVTPLSSTIDDLAVRIAVCERVEIRDLPIDPDMPQSTTGDEVRTVEVSAAESEAETDEEHLGVDEEASYEGLTEIQEAMVESVVQISLADTPLADHSGASDVDVTPGTDAPKDGATT